MKRRIESVIAALDRRCPGWLAVAVAGLTLLAFVLRLIDLGRWDLTFDESASIWIARKPPADMIRYLLGAFHEHPPLYYLSLWAWTQAAGTSEFVLRFWSVIAGVLSVPLIYVWLRRMIGRSAAFVAATLLSLSPFHIYYSQDARMYPLLGTLALLSLVAFQRILTDGRRRWWLVWIAVTLAGLSTHYFMGLVNMVEMVFLLVTWRRHRPALKPWFGLHVGAILIIALWIAASPGLQTTLGTMLGNPAQSQPLIRSLRILSFDVAHSPVSRLSHEWLWVMLLTAAAGLVVAIGDRRDRARSNAGWLIAALILVPPTSVLLTPEALSSRYVIFIAFGYVAAVAMALSEIGRRVPLAGLALTVVIAGAGVSRYEHQYTAPKSVYGQVIATVLSNWRSGDALVLNGPWQWVQLEYYWPGDVPMFFLPPQTPPPLEPEQTRPILESIRRDYRRAWVIEAAVKSADPDGYVAHWLRENAFPADRRGDLLLFYLRDDALRARPVGVLAGDALLLREVALPEHAVTAGDAVLAEMTWSIQRAPGIDLVASLGLVGTDGTTWAERVYQPGEVVTPPSTWAEGQIVTDRQALLIPVDMPRGTYTLYVNVRRADSGEALMPAGGEAGNPWIVLGTIEVERQ